MNSLLSISKGKKQWIETYKKEDEVEPRKLKFTRVLNMLALGAFTNFYVFNYIMIGFYRIYALLMIIATVQAFLNLVFILMYPH